MLLTSFERVQRVTLSSSPGVHDQSSAIQAVPSFWVPFTWFRAGPTHIT